MSPFTSNFTSDVTKNKERKKGELFGVNEHMVHAVFKRVQASETTSVVLWLYRIIPQWEKGYQMQRDNYC